MASVLLDIDSRENFNDTIDRLVELKSNKSQLIQEEIDGNKDKIFAIDDLQKKVQVLDTSTKRLYDKFADIQDFALESSDESVLSGKATAAATKGSYELEVLNLAEKQILQSEKIASDLNIPSGNIKFKVADEEFDFDYKGGSPEDFARVLTKNSNDTIEASFVKITPEESYFILQAKRGGEKNKIIVLEDKKRLLEKVGIFKKQPPLYKKLVNYNDIVEEYNLSVTNKLVAIKQENQITIPINQEVNFQDIENIFFEFSTANPPSFDEETPIAFIEYTKAGSKKKKAIPYKKSVKGYVVLNEYFLNSSIEPEVYLDNITLVNSSYNNQFYYGTIWKVVKRKEDQRFLPTKVVSNPTPSRFKFHSLVIERDSNVIDDFLPGVTLNLHKKSDKKVAVIVKSKEADFLQKVVDFINSFNIVMETINIYSAPTLEDLGVSEEQLGKDLKNRVGILKSESVIIRLKGKLREKMTKVYALNAKTKIITSQIGLKSVFNFSQPYDIDVDKIEFEQETFSAYEKSSNSNLRQLFGYDSNQDRIIDSGLAYEIEKLLENYLKSNTFFTLMKENLRSQNNFLGTSLESEERNLTQYREELEVSFSKLESARKEQKNLQNWLEGLDAK